ncbi:MAG: class II aldolase/adducin family protein [Oscillospiraceae bacterium]|jgi:ribulose-5-phosphate 4-epimerase/fuculose-1-phosphate aldolase|nr:class II aldolase/adducin family protein [Oscillospiraceae bacterium]
MSQVVGERVDYVQGGGGNTSVKLPGGLMAIKASGFRLSQVTASDGFAVVETATLRDVTAEQGYKPLRPSVEAAFHALLGTFVLHTHPVYTNLALCAEHGGAKIAAALAGLPYITVPYINPGPELAEVIRARLQPETRIVLLENHGLVVTGDTADACLALHEEVNTRLAAAYGVTPADFDRLFDELGKTLYPDQQVYLTLTAAQTEILAAVVFIHNTLAQNGDTARPMTASAQNFIAGWESEAYRKSVLS